MAFPALLIVLSGISLLATGGAFYFWLVASTDRMIAFTVAAVISAVIQVTYRRLPVSLEARNRVSPFLRAVCLSLGLAMSVISGGLAAGSWALFLRSDAVEQVMNRRNFSTLATPLYQASDQVADLAAAMRVLRARSDDAMAEERRAGTSCDGGSVPGQGPRHRLRARLKEEAAGHTAAMTRLSDEMLAVAALPNADAIDQALLNDRFAAARRLLRHRDLQDLRTWLIRHAEGFEAEAGFEDAQSGTFTCRDNDFATELRKVVAAFPSVTLPTAPMAAVRVDFATTAQQTYGQILAATGLVDQDEFDRQVLEELKMPIFIAFINESIIVVLVFLISQMNKRHRITGLKRGRLLTEAELPKATKMLALLERYTIDLGKQRLLMIPENGRDPSERLILGDLARQCGMVKPAEDFIELGAVSPMHQSVLEKRGSTADIYSAYLLNRKAWLLWNRLCADIGATQSGSLPSGRSPELKVVK